MLQIYKYARYSTLVVAFALLWGVVSQPVALAASDEMNSEEKTALLVSVMEEIEELVQLVKDRQDFADTVDTLEEADQANRSEYFFLRLDEGNPSTIYGDKEYDMQILTDGGVRQLVLTTTCDDEEVGLLLMDNTQCAEEVWSMTSQTENGIQTFTVPMQHITDQVEDTIALKVYACRWNGCVYETDIEFEYKEKVTFADQVRIYDRYEWTYEWDDKIYHVQEVLLDFPEDEVRRLYVDVDCDVSGLYIAASEDHRIPCYEERTYKPYDFDEWEVDEMGNSYNLRLESVTKNISEEDSGAVDMKFRFVGYRNQTLHTLSYRPVQKIDVAEEEDDGEDGEDEEK